MRFKYEKPKFKKGDIIYLNSPMICNNGKLTKKTIIIITTVILDKFGVTYKFRELGTNKIRSFKYYSYNPGKAWKRVDININQFANEVIACKYIRHKLKIEKWKKEHDETVVFLTTTFFILTLQFFCINRICIGENYIENNGLKILSVFLEWALGIVLVLHLITLAVDQIRLNRALIILNKIEKETDNEQD